MCYRTKQFNKKSSLIKKNEFIKYSSWILVEKQKHSRIHVSVHYHLITFFTVDNVAKFPFYPTQR